MNPKLHLPALRCVLVLLLAGIGLTACGSSGKSIELAKGNVGIFHAQLDTEQYSAIYAATDAKFKAASTEPDFTKLLEAVHNKLGTVRDCSLRNTGIAWFAGQGATVTLVYETKFTDGAASEQFVWHIKDGQATLYSYRVNSNDLVTR